MAWQEPKLDQNQFAGRRAKAVSATRRRTSDSYQDEWDTPGLAFADFSSMHVTKRGLGERRLPTPDWAVNDEALREVVLKYMESRLYIRRPAEEQDDATRREKIDAAIVYWMPRRRALLKRLLYRFTEVSKAGNTAKAENLAMEVQILESEILMMERGMLAQIVAVVYRYYRTKLNSVQVAEELKLRSPHVRQVLFRLSAVASGRNRSGSARGRKKKHTSGEFPQHELQRLMLMRREGNTVSACADAFLCSAATIQNVLRKACAEVETECQLQEAS